ncbi:dehydration-responsive family protein [Tripterygium wilfordii]|uniref:Dehydration-responsive family protein n=1 Tax=Tripterygium wilfordii TaxID=458696 RepID=A0A7J7E347_TRIWF|nr:dehydration-responsive family protein [Tripterygium wilfordii]
MPKSRTKQRQSSSSYASTVTTIVFIVLCVIGVWMLTSNSVVPPQTTARNAVTTDTRAEISSSNVSQEDTSSTNEAQQTNNEGNEKKVTPVYEDSQGDLPEDAVKSDEKQKQPEEQKGESETNTKTEESNSDNEKTGDGGGDQGTVVDENPLGLKGKESTEEQGKQRENENQVSEESTLTQKQEEIQETKTEESNNNKIQEQNEVSDQTSETSQPQNQMSNEDQQQGQPQQESESHKNPQASDQNDQVKDDQNQQERPQTQNPSTENLQQSEMENSGQEGQQQEPSAIQLRDKTNPGTEQYEGSTDDKESQTKIQTDSQDNKSDSVQETKPESAIKVDHATVSNSGGSFPGGGASGIPKESKESKKSWSTQASESENQKERRKDESDGQDSSNRYTWQLCNVTAGTDYIPCLDNEKAIKQLRTTRHFEHRERHCPEPGPTCLVPPPENHKTPIPWPHSRDKIWYHNVPHTKLAEVKGHQNWVKVTGEFLTFPGVANIAWGKHTRVILDVGCGVASFGGYLFDRDVITMSFAPKDEHEAQVQFALERGIPAISAVMGSKRLPFPSRVFDLIHCARCRVPWHAEGGMLLLELNRVLRPGGYFVWSATPVYQKLEEDVEIWKAMSSLTRSMCWDLVTIQKDKLNSIGAAIYRKPTTNECYEKRKHKSPPLCKTDDDPNASWYVPMQACMHRVPIDANERGTRWPENWPQRLQTPPYWLNSSQMGIYGKPTPLDFATDYEHWKRVVSKLYMNEMGISWSSVRNVMDMRAVYGGFASALKDLKVWVFNVVNVDSPDTLPIIYERGLFGIYHDWCESFSTYPRTYDLLHADHLFSRLKKRCDLAPVMAEVDRIVRPGGKLIVRDEANAIGEVENFLKSLHWEVHLTFSKDQEGILSAQKGNWRPETYAASS